MNKFHYIREGDAVNIHANGDLISVTSEICKMIQRIYWGIRSQSPAIALAFRLALTEALTSADSPVWQEPDHIPGDSCMCILTPNHE